jgi:transposase
VLIAETGLVSERLRVREIDDDEGQLLVRIIRRGSGSVVTWRRAQMVLLSAQAMDVAAIAKVAFTSEDRVRDAIRNFNADGFASLYPKYRGGRPAKFTPVQRREIKKIAKAKPAEYDLPFLPGACRSWPTPWWPRGWSTTSATKDFGSCSAKKASPFSG